MGIQDRKERERKQRIELILESARKVITKKGYSSTTVEEIAAEAEVSTATIYLYFKSKDDLFMALAVKCLEFVEKELDRIESDNCTCFIQLFRGAWQPRVAGRGGNLGKRKKRGRRGPQALLS